MSLHEMIYVLEIELEMAKRFFFRNFIKSFHQKPSKIIQNAIFVQKFVKKCPFATSCLVNKVNPSAKCFKAFNFSYYTIMQYLQYSVL